MDIIDRRAKHGFLLSIGTGIALNAILDSVEEEYEGVEVDRYKGRLKALYVNVRTLTRNLLNSLDKEDKKTIAQVDMSQQIYEGVLQEINYLNVLLHNNNIECAFYIAGEQYLKYFPEPAVKNPHAISHIFKTIEDMVVKKLTKVKDIQATIPKGKESLYLTHHPMDPLMLKSITILESHTGRILRNADLGKKLKKLGTYDMSIFPYVKETVYLFGDKYRYTGGCSTKIKMRAYKLLTERGITPVDSGTKIRDVMFKDKEVLRPLLDEIYKIRIGG